MRAKVNDGPCRLCDGTARLTAHHLVPAVWFRQSGQHHAHGVDNIVPLCEFCHRMIDGHIPKVADVRRYRRSQARARLRSRLTDAEVLFIVKRRGRPWLNHHYPVTVPMHDVKRNGSRLAFI